MSRVTVCAGVFALFFSSAVAAYAATAPAEDLPALISAALRQNPEVKAGEARWRASTARIAQAGALEDPMLMLKIQNGMVGDPFNFSKDGMTQKVVGLSQQIPYFGKRKLKAEAASWSAESERWSLEEKRLELTRMVQEVYYQLYATDRALEVVEKNLKVLDEFTVIAQTKYSVGQGAQQDVFKAQLERSKMLDMRITLEQQRRSQEIALNALLNRPASVKVGAIGDFTLPPVLSGAEELEKAALESRPLLKGLKAQVERGRVGFEQARREVYPDFTVALEYMQRNRAMGSDGSDMYSLGVTFNLPIQKERRQAMQSEASSEVTMAAEELNAAKNATFSGIADLLSQLDRRRKLAELYKTGIIPQAQQSLESAVISYRVNKIDFLTLLDSRMALFNYEREYFDTLADYRMKLAQLEALVGRELFAR